MKQQVIACNMKLNHAQSFCLGERAAAQEGKERKETLHEYT